MALRYLDEETYGTKEVQLEKFIEDWLNKEATQTFDELRDIIYKTEQLHTKNVKGDDGETKKMPNRKAEKIISKLKANYRQSKAMAISEAGRLAKTGTFRKTHVELLIELGVDKKQVETLYNAQPQTWKKKWDCWNWKWLRYNPFDKKWEEAKHLEPKTPSFEQLWKFWEIEAKTKSDVARKFNWSEMEVGNSESTLRNTLNDLRKIHNYELPELRELPKWNKDELREIRLIKLGNVPRDAEHQVNMLKRMKKLLDKNNAKLFGSTADAK